MYLFAYQHVSICSKVASASAVLSGKCENSCGGRAAIFCEELRDSLGGWPGSCLTTISPPTRSRFISGSSLIASELGLGVLPGLVMGVLRSVEVSFLTGGRGDRENRADWPLSLREAWPWPFTAAESILVDVASES